ncbi:MAG: Sua5/YciO/YrdC/YwlC family protein [Rickettsiales bacterium]|jgi:L-threonylcarbamoyladenylate synthase|nr:Sua5/YciO/YrdC/YwlC family protein [Rickettsiales bacterium]
MILSPNAGNIARVAGIVERGGVAIAPAGTVFGVIADAGNAAAVDAVYSLKARARSKKFLVNVSRLDGLEGLEAALARAFWPGDLSIVVNGVGYRVPSDPVLAEILRAVGRPLVSTSCNRAGGSPALSAAEAEAAFPDIPVIDSRAPLSGVPSTIVEVVGGKIRILRRGSVAAGDIRRAIC